jgi:hypothetical protein
MKRRFLFLLMAAFTFVGAQASLNRANNLLKADAVTAKQGETVVVPLIMKNSKTIANWQTQLGLPEGVTLVSVEAAERWTEAVQVTELTLFSETETPVAAGEGVVAKITLQIDKTVAAGEYTISLNNTVMTSPEVTNGPIAQTEAQTFKLTVEEGDSFIKGDVNGDGTPDVADVVVLYNIIAGNTEATPAADVNGDGEVDVADVVKLYNIIAGNE